MKERTCCKKQGLTQNNEIAAINPHDIVHHCLDKLEALASSEQRAGPLTQRHGTDMENKLRAKSRPTHSTTRYIHGKQAQSKEQAHSLNDTVQTWKTSSEQRAGPLTQRHGTYMENKLRAKSRPTHSTTRYRHGKQAQSKEHGHSLNDTVQTWKTSSEQRAGPLTQRHGTDMENKLRAKSRPTHSTTRYIHGKQAQSKEQAHSLNDTVHTWKTSSEQRAGPLTQRHGTYMENKLRAKSRPTHSTTRYIHGKQAQSKEQAHSLNDTVHTWKTSSEQRAGPLTQRHGTDMENKLRAKSRPTHSTTRYRHGKQAQSKEQAHSLNDTVQTWKTSSEQRAGPLTQLHGTYMENKLRAKSRPTHSTTRYIHGKQAQSKEQAHSLNDTVHTWKTSSEQRAGPLTQRHGTDMENKSGWERKRKRASQRRRGIFRYTGRTG